MSKDTKQAMKLNTVEGAFAVAADNLAAPYLGLFALALGATPSQIGMLNAFPNFMGNILQIPAALFTERQKDKRILPIIGGILNRSSWLVMALLPFLLHRERRVPIVILLATFRIIAANLGVPAWTALQADLIPKSIRGQYYANRNMVLNTCAVLATLLANFLLRLSFPISYQVIFVVTTILGVISVYLFSQIAFEQSPPKEKQTLSSPIWLKSRPSPARSECRRLSQLCNQRHCLELASILPARSLSSTLSRIWAGPPVPGRFFPRSTCPPWCFCSATGDAWQTSSGRKA